MDTLLKHLFKNVTPKRRPYHLAIIENGIFTISDKCKQAKKNSVILEEKINTYSNNSEIPTHEIHTGIATWDTTDSIEDSLMAHDVDFAIYMTEIPDLDAAFKRQLKNIINQHKGRDYRLNKKEKLIETIEKENWEYLYKILSKGRFYEDNQEHYFPGTLRGKIAEVLLQYFVEKNLPSTKSLNSFYNLEFYPQRMLVDGGEKNFGTKSELDVLLAYTKKSILKDFLDQINASQSSEVIFNPRKQI
ncbi:hypothetical protein HQ529_01325 [Candidatus Woesearchaeota archaeon]|nr:hypothetical protein [Candidatus Woesearchaeota archaeon]